MKTTHGPDPNARVISSCAESRVNIVTVAAVPSTAAQKGTTCENSCVPGNLIATDWTVRDLLTGTVVKTRYYLTGLSPPRGTIPYII